MTNRTSLTKITLGFGALALGVALAAFPAAAQESEHTTTHHHHHAHVATHAPQTPAQPQSCIHMQTGCP